MVKKTPRLSVNLNKIALLRNQRDVGYPCPIKAAKSVLEAGANGITIHPRPDERHITKDDVLRLAEFIADWKKSVNKDIELNIEGFPDERFLNLVELASPDQVTLVPDAPDAKTSDHGWDLENPPAELLNILPFLKERGLRLSFFMEALAAPQKMQDQLSIAKNMGASAIELYTEPYAKSYESGNYESGKKDINAYRNAGEFIIDKGLCLHAGHDLSAKNLFFFLQSMPLVSEISIGHAFISDALWMGLSDTTKAYLDIIVKAKNGSGK